MQGRICDRAGICRDARADDVEYLCRTALDFVAFPSEHDIYLHIAEKLRELIGRCVVSVSSFDEANGYIEVRAVAGLGALARSVAKLFGQEPTGMRLPASADALRDFATGRLVPVAGGVHALMMGRVPEPVCRVVERLIGAERVCVIGITREGHLMAAAAILCQEKRTLVPATVVEAFAHQASVALQRRETEMALVESERRHRQLLEDLEEVVYEIGPDGHVTYVSPASKRILGYSPSEVIGRPITDFMLPEDAPAVCESVRHRYAKGNAETNEARVRTKSGRVRWIRATGKAMRAGSEVATIRGVAFDVTEERALQQRLNDAAAEEQRRIGHDLHDGLGQELAGISCLLTTVQQKLTERGLPEREDVAKVIRLLDDVRAQTRSLANLLIPVAGEAGGLARALERLAEHVEEAYGIACSVRVCEGVTAGNGATATYLYRIVQEAVSNAVRHGKADSVLISLCLRDGMCELTVADDGIGMPDGEKEPEGFGLKTISHRAQCMGGRAEIARGSNGGTLVRVCFPNSPAAEG
jgi:PAS domain S-box-containing protein